MKRYTPTTPAEIARAVADDLTRAVSRTGARAGEHERTAEFAVQKAEEAVRRVHAMATKAAASRAKADAAWAAWEEADRVAEAAEAAEEA